MHHASRRRGSRSGCREMTRGLSHVEWEMALGPVDARLAWAPASEQVPVDESGPNRREAPRAWELSGAQELLGAPGLLEARGLLAAA
jgi:hypothetical protein